MIQIDYREVSGVPYAEVVDASLKIKQFQLLCFIMVGQVVKTVLSQLELN